MNSHVKAHDWKEILVGIKSLYRLKQLPRQGWLDAGIDPVEVESVAAHSFGCALLVVLLRDLLRSEGLNAELCLRMAVIHDLAEAEVGDITPHAGVEAHRKHALESAALAQLLEAQPAGRGIEDLWNQYEMGVTPEARLVRQIDKLDMLIQALLYRNSGTLLDEFFQGMDKLFGESILADLYTQIKIEYSDQ